MSLPGHEVRMGEADQVVLVNDKAAGMWVGYTEPPKKSRAIYTNNLSLRYVPMINITTPS